MGLLGLVVLSKFLKKKKKKAPKVAPPPDVKYTQTPVGLTPFIRENDINFNARNLKPDTNPNYFFDEIKVNGFCQRASIVNVDSSLALSNVRVNEGIYGQTSKAYAQVLGTSLTGTQNLLYVNDNFVSMNVARGDSNAMLSDEYAIGELVYQSSANTSHDYSTYTGYSQPQFTFLGKVVKWEYVSGVYGVLVVDPILGKVNNAIVNPSSSCRVFNLSRYSANVRNSANVYSGNRFSSGEPIQYAASCTTFAYVSTDASYTALSSAVPSVNVNNLRSIVLSTNNLTRDGILAEVEANTLYIVSGTNMGFSATIDKIVANSTYGWREAILASDMPALPTSNTIYSINDHVVDTVGALHGIFHIPSDDKLRWLTGERVFTITDTAAPVVNDYRMRAVAKYTALGKVNTSENARNFVVREQTPSTQQAAPSVIQETQKVNDRKFMAQTFFTPKANEIVNNQVKSSYGMFVTSIDLFFKSKPTDNEELLPFTVAISKVESGLPGNDIIAERTLEPGYIKVSSNVTPSLANTLSMTKFTFKDPVYLQPSTEYAIKLITESPDYEVWTATIGEDYTDELGNKRKVSDQPYVGNFFKSQNASNWNPILNQDLMFRVNRASYDTSKTVYFNIQADQDLTANVYLDEMRLTSTAQQFAPTNITYDVKTYLADGTVQDFVTVKPDEVYKFGKDTNVSSIDSKRRRRIQAGNTAWMNVRVTLATTDDSVSPILNKERMGLFAIQNIINNAGISNSMITITSAGSHGATNSDITVAFSAPDVGANTATGYVAASQLSSGKVLGITVVNPGAGYLSTPTVTLSEATASSNATAVVAGETEADGGNILCGYQTKIVELADGLDAGDLIVRLDAIKPAGTDVAVYFKVLSGQDKDPFVSKKWQKMTKTTATDVNSADQNNIVRIEYKHNLKRGEIEYYEGNTSYPLGRRFKYFAIKIRMTAQDPTVVPLVDSIKVLAVPGETPVASINGGNYA